METKLNLKDEIITKKLSGVVTKINDKSVWIDDKRFALQTILKNLKGVIHFESPDTKVDWTNETEVADYYLTFKQWAGVVRMGDSKKSEILEVKNNKVFYNGEYYLPYYSHHINLPEKKCLKDGFIFGYCLKMANAFYSHLNENKVNVFYIESHINDAEMQANKIKTENKKNLDTVEYLKSINLRYINGSDLDLLKENFHLLFKEGSLPYKTNGVSFSVTKDSWSLGKIYVSHRNRSGYIQVDNGYCGRRPYGNDYYAIIEVRPSFTNEAQYSYVRAEGEKITFDKAMLDSLASQVVEVWGKAIENNAINWG